MISATFRVGFAAVTLCAVAACVATSRNDEHVVNSLERCVSFMREVESDRWPSADVIEEGTEELKQVYSGQVKGSVFLGWDPEFALNNCAELFAEHGRHWDASDMEAAARWYKKRNVEAFDKQRLQLQ